jgi:hypothetical protein
MCPDTSTEGIVDGNDLPTPILVPETTTTTTVPACDVGIWPIATNRASAPCMTWAI